MASVFEITVNGVKETLQVSPSLQLIYVLRNFLNLKGTRFGCGIEECGVCMVLVDNKPAYACTTTVGSVIGRNIFTIEGLGTEGNPHPIQQAFIEEQAGQCGYCLSGILITTKSLLEENPNPSRDDIMTALTPHLCRCGAHTRIIKAVALAASLMGTEAKT